MSASALPGWQAAFVTMTFAMGGSIDDARDSLSPTDFGLASHVTTGLTHAQRDVRARTLAAGLTQLASDLTAAVLA